MACGWSLHHSFTPPTFISKTAVKRSLWGAEKVVTFFHLFTLILNLSYLETGSHFVTLAGLEFTLQPSWLQTQLSRITLPPRQWGQRCMPPYHTQLTTISSEVLKAKMPINEHLLEKQVALSAVKWRLLSLMHGALACSSVGIILSGPPHSQRLSWHGTKKGGVASI